ncbi:hypothetical protein ACU6U9_14475 [Pseudomonas sp. HK3]
MNWYKLFIPITLMLSFSVFAGISSDITSAKTTLRSAKSATSSLKSTLRDVNSEIRRVRSEISKANKNISSVRSDISSINIKTSSYDKQAAQYLKQASAFRSERDAQIARKAQLTAQLEILLEQNYELRKDIDAENIKINALTELYADLNIIQSKVAIASNAFNDTIDRNQQALSKHESWLNTFHATALTYKPSFSNITSSETYKVEHNKVVIFTDSVPTQASVKSEEDVVQILVSDLLNKVKATYEFTRELPYKKGMGYLSLNDQDSIRDELIEVDKSLTGLYIEASGIQSSIYKREYKRLYMIDFTILAWSRLIEESLLAANIQDASNIINSVAYSLNDEVAYSKIRSLLTNQKKRIQY